MLNAEVSIIEEPCAVVPHAGICAGGYQVTDISTVTAYTHITFSLPHSHGLYPLSHHE